MAAIGSSARRSQFKYLAFLWASGCALLCAIAGICLSLHLRLATTGFLLLLVIVLLSYFDSFVSSFIFSITAALLLNYLFTPPLFSLLIDKATDYVPLLTFILCSLLVTTLVRRIRDSERTQREHAKLLDLTHDTVIVRDARNRVTFWNLAAERLYGWSKEEALGQPAHALLRTEFPAPFHEIEAACVRDGEWEGELVHTRRDGTRVVVASRWALQRDSTGHHVGTLETHNNITGRKRAEARLQEIQAQCLEEAQRLSKTGSFGWQVDTGALYWSAQAYEIFETSLDLVPDLAFVRTRIHPDDLPAFEATLGRVIMHGDLFDLEHRIVFPDGRIKYLHVVAREASPPAEGRQFVGAVMDVTKSRQTSARLRQAQGDLARVSRISALGELSASIAHEVGQPLAAITTSGEACLRWLRRTPPDLAEVEGCVVQMTEEGNRAAEIVQRIRKLVKGATPEHQQIDVIRLIQDCVAILRNEIESFGAQLELELPMRLPVADGDPIQLQQVLVNLILNALQAMRSLPEPRNLKVSAMHVAGGCLSVSVRDSGTGISESDLPRLFDALFTTKATGMGMGLAISRSIVEAHGGTIVATNNEDRGATFTFTLPEAT